MKYKMIKKAALFCIVITVFSFAFAACKGKEKKENKNIILVLDTSMSMTGSSGIGYTGKNIFGQVKTSIENYIDKVSDGDKITFMTFDSEVKAFPTVTIETKNDRDILKKFISATEAKGKWTYTIHMMKSVFKKAEELTTAEKDRKTVIVIMTDAFDDPPPGKRNEAFSMKSVTNEYAGKDDWWIYFISFTDLKKNEKVASDLQKELKKVSQKSQVVEVDTSGKGIGEIDKTVPAKTFPLWIIIAIAAVVLLVIILLLLKKKGGVKVTGRLEYWNNDILDPYIEKFDMTRHMASEIMVGKNVNCQLIIRDIEMPGTFSIVALKKPAGLSIKATQGVEITFKNKEASGVLADGDIFQAGNYAFKYNAS